MRVLAVMVMLFLSGFAAAHDARPVAVTITEALPGIFQSSVRVPPTVAADNIPVLVWPAGCGAAGDNNNLVRCEGGLAGLQLTLDYPLFNPSLATFYRLQTLDGGTSSSILAPNTEVWTVPEVMTRGRVARDYLLLGVEHILGGLDHLLFVLGLLVIARTARRILLAVTGFTLAHSITLSMSSLGVINIPIVPVEAVIALSILFLAHEISRQQVDGLTYRYPMLVSFSFGLLHGLGFASALGEIGLVRNEVFVSLLFFNLGVEIGQVLFILAVAGLVWLLQTLAKARNLGSPVPAGAEEPLARRRMDMTAAYVIGVPSAYWLFERVAQFL